MKIASLLRTSSFQLAIIYMALFATSVFLLLGFIYWATAGYMAEQTDETIEAEIVGLAEQYRRQGVNGLISVIRERISREPNGKSLYLFTAKDYIKLAGNMSRWPSDAHVQDGWINFKLDESVGWVGESHIARARVFEVQGGLRLLVGRDVHDLMVVKKLIERAISWGMGITLGLALFGGVMMSRSTARRIEVINNISRKIMNGNLSLRIPGRGTGDDFDQLADNLNQMLDRIVLLMEGIRHVTDNIAHDLRTPLTRLRNQLEQTLLSVEREGDREQVAIAVAEADQMLATFNALLRIARLESAGKVLNPELVDLSSVVLDAAEFYEALAEDKEQVLDLSVGLRIYVEGDKDLLFQAVSNLIDNAIKYTPEGGRVEVCLALLQQRVVLEVKDSGIGIPAEERDKVFQRFYRVAKSRSLPGNGLGLSLVSAVISMHQGNISLGDNQPGLIVSITLPVAGSSVGKRKALPEPENDKASAH